MRFGKLIGFVVVYSFSVYFIADKTSIAVGIYRGSFCNGITRLVKIIQSRLHLKRGFAVATSIFLILVGFIGIAAIVVPSISSFSSLVKRTFGKRYFK